MYSSFTHNKNLSLERAAPRVTMAVKPREIPTPAKGQILVRVAAAAVNEMDVQVRAGGWRRYVRHFEKRSGVVTGFELSGVAQSSGTRIRAGQPVIGYVNILSGPRTHAEYVCINENDLWALPAHANLVDAAALVSMGLTALEIFDRICPIAAGQKVLILGAAGGVGVYSLQLAKHFGAHVTAVVSPGNAGWIRHMGADAVRCRAKDAPLQEGDQFDLIIDTVCAQSFASTARFLSATGCYVNTNPLRDLVGFVRSVFSRQRAGYLMMLTTTPRKLQRLVDVWRGGALQPVIDSQFALAHADQAFDRFSARGKRGRVLLTMGSTVPHV